jgi:hypothetical protein
VLRRETSITHFSLLASHNNSGHSKYLLCWLLTVLPVPQSLAHDLPACMSTVPCPSSLHNYLRFSGNRVLKEKGVQTDTCWWPGDTDSRIRLLSRCTKGNWRSLQVSKLERQRCWSQRESQQRTDPYSMRSCPFGRLSLKPICPSGYLEPLNR